MTAINLRTPPSFGKDTKALHKAAGVLSPKKAREAIWSRDSLFDLGADKSYIRCAGCGEKLTQTEFDVEHIQPLHMANRIDSGCLWRWSIDNLEAICRDVCHKVKTKREMKALAKCKRIVKKRSGTAKPKKKIQSRPFPKLSPAMKAVKAKIDSDRRDDWKNRVNAAGRV